MRRGIHDGLERFERLKGLPDGYRTLSSRSVVRRLPGFYHRAHRVTEIEAHAAGTNAFCFGVPSLLCVLRVLCVESKFGELRCS